MITHSPAYQELILLQHERRIDPEAIQKLDTANFTIKRKRRKLFVNGCKCNSLTSRCGIFCHVNMGHIRALCQRKFDVYNII
jgi:hypothetical protein